MDDAGEDDIVKRQRLIRRLTKLTNALLVALFSSLLVFMVLHIKRMGGL